MAQHILLVDDDPLLRRSLALSLEQSGYRVSTTANAEDGLALARRDPPHLVLLDIGLPGMDGLDALRSFRKEMQVPVIFLTARRRELEEVLGLELGADDYVTKPFDLAVLLARIRAILRRTGRQGALTSPESRPLVVGDLTIDPATHIVTVGGRSVELTPREFDLLVALALEPGHVLSIDELLARAWGEDYAGEPQVVYVHIRWLREKLEDDPDHPRRIRTVRGAGYTLVADQNPPAQRH